jgi:methylated-DNA-[protein]-cysteine S-methyltransferase
MKELMVDEFDSPIGTMVSVVSNDSLIHLDFADCEERLIRLLTHRYKQFKQIPTKNPLKIRDCLSAYFDKDWKSFNKIKLLTDGTEFQQTVWAELQQIPFGTTVSYAQLADNIGKPSAVRAVANANARNPIAIIIPCHRVIAKSGDLAGYAGGVHRKEWLLQHERK